MAFFIDHGKSEELVEHEKLAGVENGGAGRDGHHPANHDVAQGRVERCREQTACGQNADEPFLGIDCEEVNHPLPDPFSPNAIERFGNAAVGIEEREISARVFDHTRVEIGNASQLRHSSLLRDG